MTSREGTRLLPPHRVQRTLPAPQQYPQADTPEPPHSSHRISALTMEPPWVIAIFREACLVGTHEDFVDFRALAITARESAFRKLYTYSNWRTNICIILNINYLWDYYTNVSTVTRKEIRHNAL
jgi:hypothetical protein